jgi:hypothetical protein
MEAAQATPGTAAESAGSSPRPMKKWVLIVGYVAAVLAPVIGIIIGSVALMRRVIGHGLAIILISFAIIGLSVLAGANRGSDPGSGSDPFSPGSIDLSSPGWKAFDACIKAQRYDTKKVLARCRVPDAPN